MNQQSEIAPSGSGVGKFAPLLGNEEGDINFRHVIDLLKSGSWVILAFTVVCIGCAVLYAMLADPVYEADGLVQVETDQKSGAMADLGQLSSVLLGAPEQTQAEIQILSSRMVLEQVVNGMNLLVYARPRVFPLIGAASLRRNENAQQPLKVPSWLRSYAWGGERVDVPTFDVPGSMVGKQFKLKTTAGGFDLYDPEGVKLQSGKVGEALTVTVPDGVIRLFVRDLRAESGTEFELERFALQDVLNGLVKQLTIVEQGRQSGVISISFKGSSSHYVSEVVNHIEDAYLRQNVERRSAEAQLSLDFLQKQVPILKDRVNSAQAALNDYQLKHGSVDVAKETTIVLQSAVDLESSRRLLVQQREEALLRFTPEHPVVKVIDEKLQSIDAEEAKIRGQTNKLPTTQQEILGLMRDLDVSNQLYTALLNSVQQLEVAKAGTLGTVRIVDHSLMPRAPSEPKKTIVVALGLLLGIFLGCGYVLVQQALLRGVDDPAQLEARLGLSTFAAIPYSAHQQRLERQTNSRPGEGQLLASVSSTDLAIESLRSLRNSLHFVMLEAPNNVVMLTGPTPGIGKSFVSSNLAALLALSGKRTVVVDADMRLGHLHKYVNLAKSPGLSDYISGDASETDVVHETGVEGMAMVTAGVTPPNPSELLLHERFAQLLNYLSSRFDFVLVDTPPALLVSDAAVVGRLAGCTLLVLKSAEHPMREVEDAYRKLLQAGTSVRGVILNQVGRKLGSYGYGTYGYYYRTYGKSD